MAYANCRFCGGRGCLACEGERQKDAANAPQPIFVARYDDPEDMEALKRIVSRPVIEEAFSEGGGGMQKIELNAAIESLKQLVRKKRQVQDEAARAAPEGAGDALEG